jgi:hypothetical protein
VRAAWLWFAVALAASLGANVATAGLLDLENVPAWLRILVAGWPALAFLGGTLLAHTPTDQPRAESHREQEAAAVPVDRAPAAVEPTPAPALSAPQPEPEPGPVETPESVPAPSAARPVPAVPAALVAHARKVADDHHARTGHRIDTEALRARLGVPAPLADAIVAQLA